MLDNPQVYKDIMERLDAIGRFITENATKGIQFGFETMYRQEFLIHGVLRAIMFSVFFVLTGILFFKGRSIWINQDDSHDRWMARREEIKRNWNAQNKWHQPGDLDKAAGSEPDRADAIFFWICAAVAFTIGFFGVWNSIAHILNPGYYVIETITELLGIKQ